MEFETVKMTRRYSSRTNDAVAIHVWNFHQIQPNKHFPGTYYMAHAGTDTEDAKMKKCLFLLLSEVALI